LSADEKGGRGKALGNEDKQKELDVRRKKEIFPN
jgi:hypothetical protein